MTIQWRSALPIRQALARARFGVEASTSPEARQFLESEQSSYVIAVLGVPRSLLTGVGDASKSDAVKKALLEGASLSIANGKSANPPVAAIHPVTSIKPLTSIKPIDTEFRVAGAIDLFFVFPKTAPLTIDDKEIEFSIKLGQLAIKERFLLKDMLLKGELEL